MTSTSTSTVVLVTGANRGIGFAIIHSLAIHPTSKSFNFLLGCRDISKGEAAVSLLRSKGVTASITPLKVDVTSDTSLRTSVKCIEDKFARLDILINNAGSASISSKPDFSDFRSAFQDTYNTNVSSVALSMALFLPLLRKSPDARIINISSGRGSIAISAAGKMPPTVSIPYSISKTALNALTVEMSRYEENKNVMFQMVSPGHCRTEFNGYRGTRDPMEGANVVVELVVREKRELENAGFWETKGDGRELIRVPW